MRKIWIRMMSRRMRKTGIRVVIVATILIKKNQDDDEDEE